MGRAPVPPALTFRSPRPILSGMAGPCTHSLSEGDSRDLSFVPDGSVGLVVTSPPYPMIEMWDGVFASQDGEIRRALAEGDGDTAFARMHGLLDPVWAEVARVLCPGGWACIDIGDATRTIGDRFRLYPNHSRVLQAFSALGLDILPQILWRKQTNAPTKFMGSGMLPAGAYVTLEHEHILVMRKGPKRSFTAAGDRQKRRESACFWEERNAWYSDVWDFKGVRQDLPQTAARGRSAAFPFDLPYRLISMYSVRGDTVLDPFAGTGTTCHAAMAAGRNSIGRDIDGQLVSGFAEDCGSLTELCNRRIRERLSAHRAFVEQCRAEGRDLAYRNGPLGVPVMTAQEVDLRIELVDTITRTPGGAVEVSYREPGQGDEMCPGKEAV